MDSRIVLDHKGAELLLGQGDMLFLSPRSSKLTRAQGTLVEDTEIRQTVKFLKQIAQQNFEPQLIQLKGSRLNQDEERERDPLFDDAVRIVIESRRGSVSLLQRRLTIGYSRASRLIEQMAEAGIIGEYKGSQAREVSLTIEEWDALRAQAEADADSQLSQSTVAMTAQEEQEEDESDEDEEDDGYEEDENESDEYEEDDEYEEEEDDKEEE